MNLNLFNLKIKIDYSFLLFIILLLYISEFKIIIIVTFSLMVHEIFHLIVYKYFKKKKKEESKILLSISIFGGLASLDYKSFTRKERIILFSSGVFGNLILLLCFYKDNYFLIYNLILIVFNLIPIYPLDGYNIYKELRCYDYRKYKRIVIVIILSFLIVFMITKSFCILIIGLFLGHKNLKIREEELKNRLLILNYQMKKDNYNIENLIKI